MRMAKSLIAAFLIAAALVGAVVVPTALTRGTFAFDAWPEAARSRAHQTDVAIAEPAKRIVATRFERPPAARARPASRAATAPPRRDQLAQLTPQRPAAADPKPSAPGTPGAAHESQPSEQPGQ